MKIKKINSKIDAYKNIILQKTLETQNIILLNCFTNELNSIRSLEDINVFQYKLYNFKHFLISTDNYNFYTDMCTDMMSKLEEKREFLLKYGNILDLDSINHELAAVRENTYGFQFFKRLFHKLNLLFQEAIRQKDY